MSCGAKEGTRLGQLIETAIPLCQAAEARCPRKGRGRKPQIADWVIAVLIVTAILKQRKSKSAQYRFLSAHRAELMRTLGTRRFPSRSTYFDRYRRAWKLFEVAVQLAGERGIEEQWVSPRCLAVDKSVVSARGPLWNRRHLERGKVPRGADLEATWTRSSHHGWQLGYAYEVVVSAEKTGTVWPILASASPASWHASRTFPAKIAQLPAATRYVLADSGYDSNNLADAVEFDAQGRCTGRRLLANYPKHRAGVKTSTHRETRKRRERRARRRLRHEFHERPFARRLLRRRGARVEPFNAWLKNHFDLGERTWHYGLDNNCTQLLAAIFGYQLLLLVNHASGYKNGQLQWILDAL
jgi:hypothetical protein